MESGCTVLSNQRDALLVSRELQPLTEINHLLEIGKRMRVWQS
jgi:hypothetical protein